MLWSTVAIVLQIPGGWRHPLPNEVDQRWWDDSLHRFLHVTADFNGDGVIDEASLLVRGEGLRVALFAQVSGGDASQPHAPDFGNHRANPWLGVELN